jgi:rhamnopyranosyl-N-acetylglucosaminyl-diphospho-decaprenol beta-1,3/1,4-galactofuranosyltransferase
MTIAAVVATYNRKDLLRICLQALMTQTRPLDEVIVVDGPSTDGTDLMVKSEFPHVTYVGLKENIGGSGNFHEGMKIAYENGYDWIWVMDDDAVPASDSLEKLMEALSILNDKSEKICLWNQIISDNISDIPGKIVVLPVQSATFVGFAINRNLVQVVGFPRRDFFIYFDDLEYCSRINRVGGSIFKILGSVVYHKDWLNQPMEERKVLFITIRNPQIPYWKFYYLARNAILSSYGYKAKIKGISYASILCIKVIIIQPKATGLVALGIIHGLLGISGAVIEPQKK